MTAACVWCAQARRQELLSVSAATEKLVQDTAAWLGEASDAAGAFSALWAFATHLDAAMRRVARELHLSAAR